MSTAEKQNLLVVIDPTQDQHIALERAIITSKTRAVLPKIILFIGVDGSAVSTDADNSDLYRDSSWFADLLKPLQDENIEFQVVISWSGQWMESVLRTVEQSQADMVLVPDHSAQQSRKRFSDAKWRLLRHADCPVVMVRPGAQSKRSVVLAAVRMQSTDESYQQLNEKILAIGGNNAERYGADFHLVNAYSDSLQFPDRGKIVRDTGIASENVHIRLGAPEDVVAEVAEEINADLVVLGTMKRRGMNLAMRGNTSERVMAKIVQDIMTVN